MQVLAPAKINLHLRVGAVREDGFHPLISWMTTVGLFDKLTIDPGPEGVQLSCNDPSLDCSEKNLIVRAAKGLWQMHEVWRDVLKSQAVSTGESIGRPALRVHLEKSIPVGGGLGGGSSDAARMLLALDRLWRLDLPSGRIATVGRDLGSDVPFFLYGPSSICQGRGEFVQPVAPPLPGWALLILPQGISMPTALVYQRFDALELGKVQARLDPPWPASGKAEGQDWWSLNSDALLPRLVNDLEQPAFDIAPALGRLRNELEQMLGRIVRMSGSGSTLFTLYDDELAARDAAHRVMNQNVRAMAVPIAPTIHDDLNAESVFNG